MSTTLWNFALGLHAFPGVEQACLRLQDEHGNDVCLLLCAAWLDQRGATCTVERCAQLQALAEEWQREVVGPLRLLRRRWKPTAGQDTALTALRERLAQLELDAERELLTRLEVLSAAWPVGTTAEQSQWLAALARPRSDVEALACLASAARQ